MRRQGAGMPQILVVREGAVVGEEGEVSRRKRTARDSKERVGAAKVTKRRGVKVRRCGGHE